MKIQKIKQGKKRLRIDLTHLQNLIFVCCLPTKICSFFFLK